MDDDRTSGEFEPVRRLIRLEKGEAWKAFDDAGFRGRLEDGMRAEAADTRRKGRSVLHKLVPAAAALTLVAAGAVIMLSRRPAPGAAPAGTIFEAFFERYAADSGLRQPGGVAAGPGTTPSPSGPFLRTGSLARSIERLWAERKAAAAAPHDRGGKAGPRFTTGQRLDILFREQAIHRFLDRCFSNTTPKEVSSWSEKPSPLSA